MFSEGKEREREISGMKWIKVMASKSIKNEKVIEV